ncbi:enoyl-CoA hydratase [Mycobacterium eburneum]|nr:enoyl-CoA hydratase-related protein [Mycobacterium eburneum]TDH48352.1 enoyl-CoA hydratase [Mycobacterium eburneum]
MTDGVACRREQGTLHLLLDRPESRNAANTTMLTALARYLEDAAADEGVHVVTLTGAGSAFCAGGDLTGADTDGAAEAANRVIGAIVGLPKLVVAGVHGAAAGFGCTLALACDLVVAARKASFELAFTRVGLMPDGGTSGLLTAALGRPRAARMALLGERIDAETAADWGLISHVVDDEGYAEQFASLTATLSAGPTAAYGWTKHALVAASLEQLSSQQALETTGQHRLVTTDYFRRAVAAYRDRRPRPEQRDSKETHD